MRKRKKINSKRWVDQLDIGRARFLKNRKGGGWYMTIPNSKGHVGTPRSINFFGTKQEVRQWAEEKNIPTIAKLNDQKGEFRIIMDSITTGKAENVKIDKCVNEWLDYLREIDMAPRTVISYEGTLRSLIAFGKLGGCTPDAITTQLVNEYLRSVDRKVSTLDLYLSIISAFCRWLGERGYRMGKNPCSLARVPKNLPFEKKEKRPILYYEESDIDQLVSVCVSEISKARYKRSQAAKTYHGVDRWTLVEKCEANQGRRIENFEFIIAAIYLGFYFGLRISDCCLLEKKAFANPDYFIVHTLKRNTRVAFPLSERAIEDIMRNNQNMQFFEPHIKRRLKTELELLASIAQQVGMMIHESDSHYCWPRMTEQRANGVYRGMNNAHYFFDYAKRKLGERLKDHTFHMLRHTWARRWRAMGVELEVLASLLGHKNTSATEGYTSGA